ncbi:MAG TPA: MFS transporter [Mesorhizobium sp.]|nr:MFS transporter [Mesorhizobium sp.]
MPLILAVALFMENMDSTVIATALPAIAVDLGTSPIALKLALTAYLVSLAVFIPVSGWVADRYGAKPVFRAAIGVFVLGSLLCAASGSLASLVGARILQGAGGAMMTPVARLVLVRGTPKRELVSAMAWLTIPALIGPLAGPPLGGFIATYFGWRWIFLINVPIGILGIALAGRFLPDIPGAPRGPIDWRGFALSGAAASGIVFGLSVVSLPALPPLAGAAALGLGVTALLLYTRHARAHPQPLLDLTLFRNPTFRLAVASGTLFRIGAGAMPFLLPLLFQIGFGLTPFESGLLTFATAGGALCMKFAAPRLLSDFGFRTVLACAALLGAVLVAANALLTPQVPAAAILTLLFFAGFTRSLFFTSINALTFADIEEREASQATALSAAFQQVSIALGVAVAGSVLEFSTFLGAEGHLGPQAFVAAFLVAAAFSAAALLPIVRLPPTAGSAVSGHLAADEDAAPSSAKP